MRVFQWLPEAGRWNVDDIRHASVFWTQGATYILGAADDGDWVDRNGQRVHVLSVDGAGHPRWAVSRIMAKYTDGASDAIRFFGVKPV